MDFYVMNLNSVECSTKSRYYINQLFKLWNVVHFRWDCAPTDFRVSLPQNAVTKICSQLLCTDDILPIVTIRNPQLMIKIIPRSFVKIIIKYFVQHNKLLDKMFGLRNQFLQRILISYHVPSTDPSEIILYRKMMTSRQCHNADRMTAWKKAANYRRSDLCVPKKLHRVHIMLALSVDMWYGPGEWDCVSIIHENL